MFNFAAKIISFTLWAYCLYQDIVTCSIWWFIGDLIIIPMGVIRGLLKVFGII